MQQTADIKGLTNRLLSTYQPQPGVADELFRSDGSLRPVWRPLIQHLSRLSQDELEEHFSRGTKYLSDAGVYFRQYSASPAPDREWPLSPIPVVIDESEWSAICDGLTQRADLLERIMADLYGDGTLVAQGHLPAKLIARSPAWHRPLVGIRPASGYYLHHVSFDISRNPDGTWFVLGDRTQAPSGAGFALENRIATSRIFNDLHPRLKIHRLAGFFRSFREALDALPGNQNKRSAVLSPGPNNASYFEHTYIARYLGLLLLEGEDMFVQNGQVMVRTIEGPKTLGAIWRKVDTEYTDPLELREDSHLGTPGLVNALRQGSVSMINALGSGVLEMRAMMAFLPKISEVLTGEPLRLPNIATWWCGQPAEREFVKANSQNLMIGDAIDQDLPLDIAATSSVNRDDGNRQYESVEARIDAEGGLLVGQEPVAVSTAPVYRDGCLVPRPMTVRVTAARTSQGWIFMPGGYARFGSSDDATAMAMQRGGSVADVWIVGENAASSDTLLSEGDVHRIETEVLPSRAAENLFWLGRYVERTEAAFRLVRAYHLRLAETDDREDERLVILDQWMENLGIDTRETLPSGLINRLDLARACAGKVRDRFSTDGWSAIQDLSKTINQMSQTVTEGDDCARAMSVLLRKINGFSGLVHENMYRFAGWRFLAFGRALERCDTLASVLLVFAQPDALIGGPEIAVELGDNAMTHRRLYRGSPTRASVFDLLACDPLNPRSIIFQINHMIELAEKFPRATRDERPSQLKRILLPLQAKFATADPTDITPEDLTTLRVDLASLSDLLWSTHLR